jgi:hypothetical protein
MFSVRRLLEAKVPAEALIKLAEDKSKTKEEMKTIPAFRNMTAKPPLCSPY